MEKRNEQLEVLEDVHEMLTEAMKTVANEPSVGLYFVQQHVHKAVPSLLNVKHQITEATTGVDLATADVKDSLSCIKSMKDCGPLVIERMIKSLQTASTQIPTNRQSRGSFSQLLPRPIRPPGLSKAPLRSSSFLGDWHSDSSTKKSWENYQRGRPLGDVRNKKGPGEKPALPFPDTKRAENSQKKGTDLNQQETSSSPACESSDALKRNGLSDGLNDISTSDAHYYILSLLGSAIQKAGSAGREGVKLIAKDIESQIVNDGRVIELKNWISGQGLLGFSRKTESMSENPEGQIQPIEPGSSHEDLVNMKDSFEKFQAERIAKLEAWLSQPDDNNSSSSSQNK